ncbi:MAG: response regulator [Endomicrobiia bacterium]|nr:response regulator [Endomicrobiia bacterium]
MSKILVVEDEQDIAEIVAMALEHAGHEVEISLDGEDALEKMTSFLPDVVVLDLMLPKMDGREFAAKIKSDPLTASAPVIVITAHAKLKELLESKSELNVAAYLEKPFPIATLIEKIAQLAKK